MSREVKFRAWNKLAHKMATIDALDFMLDAYRAHVGKLSGSGHLADIDLIQFTGLKDKNGKDIFEGDILSHPGSSPWLVECGKIGLGDHEIDCHGWLVPQVLESYEIIGNLYENGDLLK